MTDHQNGDSRVSILLTGVSEKEVEELSEAVCDLLRDRGLGNRDAFQSLVIAEGWQWPASDPESFLEEIRIAGGTMYVPDAGKADD